MDRADAQGVLGSDRGDYRSAENAEVVKGLEIGLNPGAPAGIRTCNREGDLHC